MHNLYFVLVDDVEGLDSKGARDFAMSTLQEQGFFEQGFFAGGKADRGCV